MVYVKCLEFIMRVTKEAKEERKDGYFKLTEVSNSSPPPMGSTNYVIKTNCLVPVGEPIGYVGLIERPAAEKKLQGKNGGKII